MAFNFKRVSLFLFASLLSLLLMSCPHLFDPSDFQNPQGFGGTGTFTLYMAGSQMQGRTILPSTANNQFAWYRLKFSGAGSLTVDRTFSEITDPVQLAAGVYTLTVYAYTSTENKDADRPAAHGSMSVTIVANTPVSGTIDLQAYGVGNFGGKGNFKININFPDDLNAVRMELQPVSSTPGSSSIYNFIDGSNLISNDENLEVNAGYYRVVFTLEKTNMRNVIWRETLHIYENMTSSYSYTFTNDHFQKSFYTVIVDYDNGTPNDIISYFFDEDYLPGINPLKTGHTFDGFYKDGSKLSSPLPYLTGNTFILANWIVNQYTITFDNVLTPNALYEESGVSPASITDDFGTTITAPTPPVMELFNFLGWYTNESFITRWEFSTDTIPAENITLYARWEYKIGKGTPEEPFLVTSVERLQMVGKGSNNPSGFQDWTLDKHYRQPIDLNMSGQVFTPIGTSSAPFTGTYNGEHRNTIFNIFNLTINNGSSNNTGMFGYINGSGVKVSNLGLVNVNITGAQNTGGITGYLGSGAIIENCRVTGAVYGSGDVGGLIGNNNGTITNCYNTATVTITGGNNAGGITGSNSGTVSFCYNTGNVIYTIANDSSIAGGIVGINSGTVSNNVALNSIITTVGLQYASDDGTEPARRITGQNSGTLTNNRARNDMFINGHAELDAYIGANFVSGANVTVGSNPNPSSFATVFAGWSSSIWNIPSTNLIEGITLPMLRGNLQAPVPVLPAGPAFDWSVYAGQNKTSSAINFNTRNLIHFESEAEQEGWFIKRVPGKFLFGEMVEGVAEISISYTGSTTITFNSLAGTHALGTIGRFIVTNTGGTNYRMVLELNDLAIENWSAVIRDYSNQNDTNPRISNVNNTSNTFTVQNGRQRVEFDFKLEASGNWEFKEHQGPAYPVFEEDGITRYYWRDEDGIDMWSFGEASFVNYKLVNTPTALFGGRLLQFIVLLTNQNDFDSQRNNPNYQFVPVNGSPFPGGWDIELFNLLAFPTDIRQSNIFWDLRTYLTHTQELLIDRRKVADAVVTVRQSTINISNTGVVTGRNGPGIDVIVTFNIEPDAVPALQSITFMGQTVNVTGETVIFSDLNTVPYGLWQATPTFNFRN